jgi:3-hydroxyacyl-CoA dehydrogenase
VGRLAPNGGNDFLGRRVVEAGDKLRALGREVSTQLGITRRPISDEEIPQRLLYPMVNEGAKILEGQTAIRAGGIDVI